MICHSSNSKLIQTLIHTRPSLFPAINAFTRATSFPSAGPHLLLFRVCSFLSVGSLNSLSAQPSSRELSVLVLREGPLVNHIVPGEAPSVRVPCPASRTGTWRSWYNQSPAPGCFALEVNGGQQVCWLLIMTQLWRKQKFTMEDNDSDIQRKIV